MAPGRLRLSIACSDPEDVVRFVDRLAEDAGLGRDTAYWLRLAADEISTNIAHHGYCDDGGVLDLVGWAEPDRVCVQIEDDAPPFDPRGYDPAIRHAAPIEERQQGGYGLILAMSKVDEFGYHRVGGRNRYTLTMLRAGPPVAEPEPVAVQGDAPPEEPLEDER